MAITAKELARKLNISATAVSMALNNKPGVSTETRKQIIKAAEKYGGQLVAKQEKEKFFTMVKSIQIITQ